MKWLFPILFILGCATTQPVPTNVCPTCPPQIVCPPTPAPVIDTVTKTITKTDSFYSSTIIYRDTSGSNTVLLDPNSPDNSLAIQTAIDQGGIESDLPGGHFMCKEPLLIQLFTNGQYVPVTKILRGTGTYREADGQGTILDFSQCTSCAFGIGVQVGYGCVISGITLIGRWQPPNLSGYAFYTSNGLGNGVCTNGPNELEAGIVFDPWGPKPAPDGKGYTGVDAYGNDLSLNYRGGYGGSSGDDVHDIKFQNWLCDFILSPNGFTENNESHHVYKINSEWGRWFWIGCQTQEKQIEIGPEINIQGPCETVFQLAHGWGQGQPGQYYLHGFNVNGLVQHFMWVIDNGFFRTKIENIYAESLGGIGMYASNNASTFDGEINFADYTNGGAFEYIYPQIQGTGVHYSGHYRMYNGQFNPITIDNLNGFNYFEGSFDKVPYYNTDYNVPGSHMVFQNTTIGGTQTDSPIGIPVPIDSTAPGQNVSYLIQDSLVGLFRQATIQCQGNELSRISVGSILIAYNGTAPYAQQGVAGIVTATQTNSFTLCYIPSQIISGQRYFLSLWTQKL
jgi:hypothetical protein